VVTTVERVRIEKTAVTELAQSFRGELIRPDDDGYETHRRTWNFSIDRYPALIARCTGVADIRAALRFGRSTGLPIAVRGGSHSFPGMSTVDDGLVIDLSLLKGIRVDPTRRIATAQPGVLLGELDRETQEFGLAVPAGIVTTTGLAGLTLGGGIGWLMRKYGLTIDQLLSVDVVTADGELVTANDRENTDLFWGIRGGGGNFGIVTQFEFRLNPVGPIVLAGPMFWAVEDSPEVMGFYREWITDVPDEMMSMVIHRKAPPLPFVPQALHGKPVVTVVCCYAGPVEDGERVIRPMREFGNKLLDVCVPKPFLTHQAMFDAAFPRGWHYYFRPCDLPALTDDVVEIVAAHAARMQSPNSVFPLFHMGGAVARVGDNETAYGPRSAGHIANINGTTKTPDGFDEERQWVRGLWSALEPYATSAYQNFMMDEGESRVRQAYGERTYARLQAVKRSWDPENVFRINQNILPA
jgi:FAD/FMN-containing dehydrogenase